MSSAHVFRSLRGVAYQAAVGENHNAIRETFSQRTLVRNQDDGHTQSRLNLAQQKQNLLAVHAIEVSGGLVGEENRRAIDQGAGQRATLLLAARQLAGPMPTPRSQAHMFERSDDPRLP